MSNTKSLFWQGAWLTPSLMPSRHVTKLHLDAGFKGVGANSGRGAMTGFGMRRSGRHALPAAQNIGSMN